MELTKRQTEVLEFIKKTQRTNAQTPSLREIARHFGFRSMTAAADHVRALKRKGMIEIVPRRARSLRILSSLQSFRQPVVDIPLYGEIPAGFADERHQEAKGCISVDVQSLGIRPTARTFALQVRGDSMIGRHILEGDYVIVEQGITPQIGDVVAALIDQESTLKTFMTDQGKPVLKAENPCYPTLVPAQELMIQGVMVGLIRKMK